MNSLVPNINIIAKRAISLSMRMLKQDGQGNRTLQIGVTTAEPLNKNQEKVLNDYFQLYAKDGQDLDFIFAVDPYLRSNDVEVTIDGKKLGRTPHNILLICGKHLDMQFAYPPGKPKGAEARVYSANDSPVYQGVARKLGYKPIKGFQHP